MEADIMVAAIMAPFMRTAGGIMRSMRVAGCTGVQLACIAVLVLTIAGSISDCIMAIATTAIGISIATIITIRTGVISGMGAGGYMASVRAGDGRTTMTNSYGSALKRARN
jgi:hypothetical protein